MLNKLAGMVRDACAVIPQGGTVEILDNKGASTADIHERLKSAMDAEMSKVIMGQTLTAEVSAQGGSRAQGQVHEDILEDFRAGDQKLVKTAMEEIAWVYGQINAPGVPTPAFQWFEEEEPQKDFADRDKTLKETGVRFRKSYYVRRDGLQEDDFDLEEPGTPGPPADFAEANDTTDLVQQLADKAMAQADGGDLVEAVYRLLNEAGSLEQARDRLLDLYPDMALEPTADALAQALALADLTGRDNVEGGQ
jgi:phage gp29-like protein